MAVCLERAFGNLKLFCMVDKLLVTGVRSFTVANMHAAKNAYPFLGCKGSDTPVILKWLCFYVGLQLGDTSWPAEDRKALEWTLAGARAGLSFTQGIHGHGIWLSSSCARFLRNAVQSFGNCYAHLAEHCLNDTPCSAVCRSFMLIFISAPISMMRLLKAGCLRSTLQSLIAACRKILLAKFQGRAEEYRSETLNGLCSKPTKWKPSSWLANSNDRISWKRSDKNWGWHHLRGRCEVAVWEGKLHQCMN